MDEATLNVTSGPNRDKLNDAFREANIRSRIALRAAVSCRLPPEDIGITAGVSGIAADLLGSTSRQGRAKKEKVWTTM
jgi:hypothetical protein